MIDVIINGIFKLVTLLAGAILTPIIAFLTSVFPDLGTATHYVVVYFASFCVNIPMVLDLLFIPYTCMIFLFDYYIIKYTIYIATRSVKCALAIYNKFKI